MDATVRWEVANLGPNNLVLEPLMVAPRVIMQNELRGGLAQGRLSDQDQFVQTGLFDTPKEPFCEGVQFR